MIRVELFLDLLLAGLWIYCLFDVITTDEGAIRNLPKLLWILIVLFLPLIGSIAWFVAGRPEGPRRPSPHERAMPHFPEYDRPGRAAATNPEDDEAFLRQVRERAEEQRRRYREEQRRAQREAESEE